MYKRQIYIIPSVTGALISSYTAEYGELKVSDETTGYIVRNETVYLASSGGEINRYIEEGSLVRQGTSVMEINGGSGEEISSEYTDLLTRLGDAAVTSQDYTCLLYTSSVEPLTDEQRKIYQSLVDEAYEQDVYKRQRQYRRKRRRRKHRRLGRK